MGKTLKPAVTESKRLSKVSLLGPCSFAGANCDPFHRLVSLP